MVSSGWGGVDRSSIFVAFGLIACGCNSSTYEIIPSLSVDERAACTDSIPFVIETVATGLEIPWDLDFTADGRIFVTERPGRIRVIEDGVLRQEPWAELSVFAAGVAGLMGIAVSPDFPETGYVYVVGTFSRIGTSTVSRTFNRLKRALGRMVSSDTRFAYVNRVYRLRDVDGKGVDPAIVVDDLPSDPYHAGGALDFGPDGMLYVTTGDAAHHAAAQDLTSLAGKILRYAPDGSVPADNPLRGSPVYARGIRNSQGLAWHPITGDLFATEHGPSSGESEGGRSGYDEVNVINPGSNHGWPIVVGPSTDSTYSSPLATWMRGIAPSGVAILNNEAHRWHGQLFVGGLKGRQVWRGAIAGSGEPHTWEIVCAQPLAVDVLGRVRAVRSGPDGHLYVTTSNRDHRGAPGPDDDGVFRFAF